MQDNFTKTYLFACPVYTIRIDPTSYDKEKILKDIFYNKSLNNVRNDSEATFDNCNIHHSYKDLDNEDFRSINYETLIPVYEKIFNEFFDNEIHKKKSFNYKFEIVNYSAITEGQWLPPHSHLGAHDYATVHYLNFKDGHGFTRFINPATFAPFVKWIQKKLYNDILDPSSPDNSYLWEHFWLPIKEDDMVIFPAALEHEISVQGSTKEPRVTLSTNIEVL